MEDIVPGLLERIKTDFSYGISNNSKIKSFLNKVRDGTATYADGNQYAIEIGKELSKAYELNLYSDALPDGKMYFNIANRIITPTMMADYDSVSEMLTMIQETLNDNADLGWKALIPEVNQDRIDGIINRVSSEDTFDDVSWILKEPIINFSQSIVDDFIEENAEFQAKSGTAPRIVRKLAGKCCDWCKGLAGSYSYPDVPKDVYRRHDRCRCTVELFVGKTKSDTIHSGTEGKRKYQLDKYGTYVKTDAEKKRHAEEMKNTESERKAAARQKRIETWRKKHQVD